MTQWDLHSAFSLLPGVFQSSRDSHCALLSRCSLTKTQCIYIKLHKRVKHICVVYITGLKGI